MAFLIEKYAGAFPLWLAPEQVVVIPVSEPHHEYAETVFNELKAAGIRVILDTDKDSLGKKIRNAKQLKAPYLIVIGDKEIESQTVTLESRSGDSLSLSVDELTKKIVGEIKTKALF